MDINYYWNNNVIHYSVNVQYALMVDRPLDESYGGFMDSRTFGRILNTHNPSIIYIRGQSFSCHYKDSDHAEEQLI